MQSKAGLSLSLLQDSEHLLVNNHWDAHVWIHVWSLSPVSDLFFVGTLLLAFLVTSRVTSKYIRFLKLYSVGEWGMNLKQMSSHNPSYCWGLHTASGVRLACRTGSGFARRTQPTFWTSVFWPIKDDITCFSHRLMLMLNWKHIQNTWQIVTMQ